MGSSHVSGSNDRKERRPAVIMPWGHRPWFSQTSKRERPCSCMLPSFLAEQATRRMEAPQAKRERQPLGRVEPPQSASQGLWLQKAAPHPAGNRSCCHISAPHGFCPPVWLQLSLTSYLGQRLFASRKPSLPARCFLSARKRKTTGRAWAAVMYQAATTGIKERRPAGDHGMGTRA